MLSPATTRRLFALGALMAIGFAIYGSLVPLHARAMTFGQALAEFRALRYVPFALASKTDFLSNVALFLPIGFLATGALASGRHRAVALAVVPVVVTAAGALSVSIEFAQVFIPDRTASMNDIANETLGSLAGALAWVAAGPLVATWLAGFAPSTATSSDIARRVLTAYAAAWLVLGLLPFDITIRPAELAQKFRAGRIHVTPLFGGPRAASQVIVSTALLAAPIGALAALGWPRARQAAAWPAGALSGAAAIAGLELCQVFIFSRTASMDDAIGGAIGASAGAVLAWRLSRSEQHVSSTSAVRLWPVPVLVLWLLVIAIRHWSPFDFVVTGDMVRSRWPALVQVPFRSYYWANPFAALGEAITKVFLGLPVGALLALAVPLPRSGLARAARIGLILAIGLGIFTTVEVGQMFLPSRYPDETDILLGVLGTWLGASGAGLGLSRTAPAELPSGSNADKRYPTGRLPPASGSRDRI